MTPPDEVNPYAAPTASVDIPRRGQSKDAQLASLGQRLGGAIIDGLFSFVVAALVAVVGIFALGIDAEELASEDGFSPAFLGVIVVAGLLVAVPQLYLLATRSQSVGKLAMKTRIDMANGSGPAPWVNTILIRGFLSGAISSVPLVGAIYAIADPLFIFRADRRCIHDLMASTVVNKVD